MQPSCRHASDSEGLYIHVDLRKLAARLSPTKTLVSPAHPADGHPRCSVTAFIPFLQGSATEITPYFSVMRVSSLHWESQLD